MSLASCPPILSGHYGSSDSFALVEGLGRTLTVELLISKGAKSSVEILAWAERQDRPDVARFVIEKISRTMTAPGTQATLTFWRKI